MPIRQLAWIAQPNCPVVFKNCSRRRRLRAELRELNVLDVGALASANAPDDAKGIEAALGWLVVRLGREPVGHTLTNVI